MPTLEGKATVKIPAGTQPATRRFRAQKQGREKSCEGYMPRLIWQCAKSVQVEVPTRLNHEQKAKLQEFAGLLDGNETPIAHGFFEKAKKFFK